MQYTSSKNPDIQQKVIDIIAEVCVIDKFGITCMTSLQEDLSIDSVDTVSLILALEDEFGGTISDEEVEKLRTVEDIVAHIEVGLNNP